MTPFVFPLRQAPPITRKDQLLLKRKHKSGTAGPKCDTEASQPETDQTEVESKTGNLEIPVSVPALVDTSGPPAATAEKDQEADKERFEVKKYDDFSLNVYWTRKSVGLKLKSTKKQFFHVTMPGHFFPHDEFSQCLNK